MGRSGKSDKLDHISILGRESGIIMRLVIGDMRRLPWVEFYGLNYLETMELEFSVYLELVKSLEETNKKVESATSAVSNNLINKYERNVKAGM